MKIKKFLTMALMVLTGGAMCSCGGDDGEGEGFSGGYAPADLRGHNFNFFYEYGGELYRSVSFSQNADGTFAFLSYSSVDSYGAKLEACTKTSANTLHIEILSSHLNGEIGDYWEGSQYQDFDHNYTFDLLFTAKDQGIAYVTETKYALDYWGNWGKQTTKSTWYFRMDSAVKPDKDLIDAIVGGGTGGDGTGPGDGGQGGGDTPGSAIGPNELRVDISAVYPTSLYYHVEYTNPGKYTDLDDYLTAGVCYGTEPGPTILDETTPLETVRPNSDSYAAMTGLEPNTTYYLRPFMEVNGTVTYFQETSVKTPGADEGSDVMLKLAYLYDNTMKIEYEINVEGTYKLELWTWDLQGSYCAYEMGYKTKGDSGTDTYRWSGLWRDTRYFYLVAKEIETGVSYRSNNLYRSGD